MSESCGFNLFLPQVYTAGPLCKDPHMYYINPLNQPATFSKTPVDNRRANYMSFVESYPDFDIGNRILYSIYVSTLNIFECQENFNGTVCFK